MEPTMEIKNPWAGSEELKKEYPRQVAQGTLDNLYTQWKNSPGKDTVEPLLQKLTPTIDAALTTYAGGKENDLRTRANILAVRALETYDPKKGVKLNTHVHNSLQKLYREKANRQHVVHIPENVILEKNRINKASRDFEARKGREPNAQELADLTGLSVGRLQKLSKYKNTAFESQFLSEKGDVLFSTTEDPHAVWLAYVYNELDPVDKKVFEWSTGYGGTKRLPKKEIAQKLRISAPAVSSRINKIIRKLEEGYNV